jgi:hypothetical protein
VGSQWVGRLGGNPKRSLYIVWWDKVHSSQDSQNSQQVNSIITGLSHYNNDEPKQFQFQRHAVATYDSY